MGKAVERIFLPLMRMTIPELVDVNLPVEGVFHNLMIVSIRKSYPGQARKVMNAIWSLGQAMFTKCIIVVDEDANVQDVGEVVLEDAEQYRSGARYPVHAGAGGFAGSFIAAAGLRLEDGHRCDAQVADGRIHASMAG